ncbi:Putative Ca2+/H+ antiporter, TMEM165/GDT1 family [Parasphingorhabdus marina DSM 22363]|uniref:GDT1 family protein n=1 Tax=Parasphingorhabdus marina DSM 22363 TaxID=1123272 RepID=A0A1N6CNM4_9SPHN|nr:TMEM165/GDT1 family protein [Parasphingorhabdus marina]SIN60035.1 Putative Ca2+/H+ antiporter, TMEM165/GDT1 family [Parasphingorhabdus marina DSM 22363]
MDAFLTSLFALAIAEFGDRPQILCAALVIRFGRVQPVVWGLALATLVNCLLSAWAGSQVNQWISEEPVRLFYALSLLLAGVAMLAWRRPVDLLENWSTGAFWTSFLGLFILQFGDKGQFILAATAARTDAWIFAAIGGWIGVMLACLPAIILQERLAQAVPVVAMRKTGGTVLVAIGIILAMSAWGVL